MRSVGKEVFALWSRKTKREELVQLFGPCGCLSNWVAGKQDHSTRQLM